MNIFEEIKEAVSVKEIASFYGLNLNRNGFCICPFHPDKNPSMKVEDTHYHCFGCGAHGDAVNLVAELYGLSQYDAVKKIIHDLQLPIDISIKRNMREAVQKTKEESFRVIALQVRKALQVLHEYHHLLITWKRELAPDNPETDISMCHPLFLEALGNLEKVNWMMDELMNLKQTEQIEFLKTYGEEIKEIESRRKTFAGMDRR